MLITIGTRTTSFPFDIQLGRNISERCSFILSKTLSFGIQSIICASHLRLSIALLYNWFRVEFQWNLHHIAGEKYNKVGERCNGDEKRHKLLKGSELLWLNHDCLCV